MSGKHRIYLSLGSNQGDRLTLMLKALRLLVQNFEGYFALSSLYETPAWGFESAPFYNACVGIESHASPHEVFEKLVQIEQHLGRNRSSSKTYEARTMDLDVLFYDDLVFEDTVLTLPHPQIEKRNFVLYPMAEIASDYVHPRWGKNMQQLRDSSADASTVHQLPFSHWTSSLFDRYPFIAIEGNIGAGKTTLAQLLAKRYQVPILLESFLENPYLEKFYEDAQTYAVAVETFFLKDRIIQGQDFWKTQPEGKGVSDYTLYKSAVFAQQNLKGGAMDSFMEAYQKGIATYKHPDLLLFLEAPTTVLLDRIALRARTAEKNIEADYLDRIAQQYETFLAAPQHFPVVRCDTTNSDFEKDPKALDQLLLRVILTLNT